MPWSIDLQTLELLVSPARLAPYRAATASDGAAVELYLWNCRVSAAMWEVLGMVEVVVRNAMHNQLTTWSIRQHQEPVWYRDPGGHLAIRQSGTDVPQAIVRATMDGRREELPGRVVAELTFGFWRILTSTQYDGTFWRFCLYRAFPGKGRRQVHAALQDLNRVRNRIGHHEPIHREPLEQLHDRALEVAGWIHADARQLIAARSRVVATLRTRPVGT